MNNRLTEPSKWQTIDFSLIQREREILEKMKKSERTCSLVERVLAFCIMSGLAGMIAYSVLAW